MNLFYDLQLTSVTVYSSLDEPLLKYFGSNKIVPTLQQMGVQEEAPLQHAMITSAIKKAQDPIADKVYMEMAACSQAEWLMINLIA
ncbi:MAG: hypothetical protein ICV81_09640 [Flavisolibacter sp.]|nr:hypothetical protein [Flavisolibacter sp.]